MVFIYRHLQKWIQPLNYGWVMNYRVTVYNHNGEKDIEEISDEDSMRDAVDQYLNEVESGKIRTFMVSRINKVTAKSNWWD